MGVPNYISDSFNRADGAVGTADAGGTWSIVGTPTILANQLTCTSTTSVSEILQDGGVTDGTAQVTFATVKKNAGITFRNVTTTGFNGLYFRTNTTATAYQLEAVGGVGIVATGGTPANGDVLKVVFVGSKVQGYVNGTLLLTATMTNFATNTLVGPHLSTANNFAVFDDFSFIPILSSTDSASGAEAATIAISVSDAATGAESASVLVKPDGIAVSDSFNRADSSSMGTAATGQAWTNGLLTWGISGNQAAPNTLGNTSTFIDAGTADMHAKVTFSAIAAGGYSFLLFRYQDDNNRLLFGSFGVGQVYQYLESVGGSTTRTVNGVHNMAIGDVVEVVASGTGIQCYVNGNLEINITSTTFQTKTKAGMQCNKTTTLYDDFSVSLPTEGAIGVDIGGVLVASSDAGSGTDNGSLLALLPSTDTGGGIGSASVVAAIPSGDVAQGVESAMLALSFAVADSGTAVEKAVPSFKSGRTFIADKQSRNFLVNKGSVQ